VEGLPAFDFSIPEVKTMTTSIHKWIPSPLPSSIFLLRDKKYLPHVRDYGYFSGQDYTFGTSRNGHTPLFLWDFLIRRTLQDHIKDAIHCRDLASYLFEGLKKIERDNKVDLMLKKT
jgi:histidine decarboxylase